MLKSSVDSVQANRQSRKSFSERSLHWSGVSLVGTVWLSALLFGSYILAFYATALFDGDLQRWNEVLPGLYEPRSAPANYGIGLHFAAGGLILVLGCIQLLSSIRDRFPAFHRWTGRVYVTACLLAAAGGLIFIFFRGTIGGTIMDIGFGLYGILMLWCAVETARYAIARNLGKHQAWAIRLFALAIGSWLYRMDYGFWLLLTDGLGHTNDFTGIFDRVMAFFFYIPNLMVAEIFIRRRKLSESPIIKGISTAVMVLATLFILTGTYFFTVHYWGPAILDFFFS